VYERDHVLIGTGGIEGAGGDFAEAATIGHNFETVLADLDARMRAAAGDLDFEEAARLRDEIKRLRATELAVVDDPLAKRPSPAPRSRGEGQAARSRPHKPDLDEMGIATWHEVAPERKGKRRLTGLAGVQALDGTERQAGDPRPSRLEGDGRGEEERDKDRSRPHRPDLDSMGPGTEAIPYREGSGPRSPDEAHATSGPRSTMGKPGERGGWKAKKFRK
jgi:excinuclease ABC subunit B